MSDDENVCPCDTIVHPRRIHNPPGLDVIEYRTGDYASFRQALLQALPGEQALERWQPSAEGDLALQLLEWWAYLADILTFYNERIANDSYLRTAYQPASASRLVNLLGYRPRPALGATGKLSALLSAGHTKVTVPQGLPLQSKPSPGEVPQIFEVDAVTAASAPGVLEVDPALDTAIDGSSVLLSGVISSVRPFDQLLLVAKSWNMSTTGYAWVTVQSVAHEKDPRENINTRVTFTAPLSGFGDVKAKDCRLLRSTLETKLYVRTNAPGILVFLEGVAHLTSVARDLAVGDLVLFASSQRKHLAQVTEYKEVVWYENAPDGYPGTPPGTPEEPVIPLPNLHADIYFAPGVGMPVYESDPLSGYRVLYGFRDVGSLIDNPPAEISVETLTLIPRAAVPTSLKPGSEVLVEDATGSGSLGKVDTITSGKIVVERSDTLLTLKPPLRLFYNLLTVSRGQTVPREVMGDGDATKVGQTFALQQSPLTHFAGAVPGETLPYRNTLRVWVNDIAWTEVESFYGQPPDAHVFTTRQDEEGKTFVVFGDGINGARLPTGKGNVVASYRYGAGAAAPKAGALTVLLKPLTGLSAVRNPVPVGGGADMESPAATRRAGPRSVLTFGRAISGDDYEAIAFAAGVPRVKSIFAWDAEMQRAVIKLYVGGDPGAVGVAVAALEPAIDPNRPLLVLPAIPKKCTLALVVVADPRYEAEALRTAVESALLDPDAGPFRAGVGQIGGAIYDSWIIEACLRVPGAIAVSSLVFASSPSDPSDTQERHDPGEGGFFTLAGEDLDIAIETTGAQP
ncbi:hypothetical protein [Polyangium fumosum]|uniref:Baseplate assembly protein n=1 Tax=Polyangium fumosum TaxID=889272 RepID=A0A4U1IPC0_9BACT|nr:hypothetical protein [Polyangium fumosum]TKC95823.1 hypothetical protein E8A74_46445 [Polyangium fumosum]